MGLFTTEKTPQEPNMISQGIILKPGKVKSKSIGKWSPSSRGPSAKASTSQTVEIEESSTSTYAHINFAKNFNNWVISPILNDIYDSNIKIPEIHLKEYRLLNSTLWEQIKYFGYVMATAPDRAADDLRAFIGDDNFLVKSFEGTQSAVDGTFKIAKTVLEALKFDTPDTQNLQSNDPYEGIYKHEETGFQYTLPLYTENMKSKNASFSDSYSGDGKGILPTLIHESVKNWANTSTGGARALIEPGIYIEKTQFYNFGQNLESITFSFPLLNTISQEQINENYQFLFLLLFQSSMYRKDRSAFIPPCIYEVLVPGIRYMKYAYVGDLKVDFIGTRRMIEVDSGIGAFKTIIPEAYNVTMTLNGMHEEGGNFIIRSASNSFDEIKIRDITNG